MPDDVDGLTTLLDDGSIVVDIRHDLEPSDKLLTCVHEAVHVLQFVQRRVETEIDEETAAYLIQSIVGWMTKRLKIATSTQQSGKQG